MGFVLNILLGDGTVAHDQFWCCCVTFSVVMCGFGSSELGKESLGCVVFGGVWRDHCDVGEWGPAAPHIAAGTPFPSSNKVHAATADSFLTSCRPPVWRPLVSCCLSLFALVLSYLVRYSCAVVSVLAHITPFSPLHSVIFS